MKKVLSLLICALMITSVCFADGFIDMPDNWATEALTNAVNNGLIGGSNGYIRPDDPMTRAEMATIMVRAFGATEEADLSEFTDVKPTDWFYSSMAKAVAMGAFNGSDGKLNPQNNITREETFAVLARMFSLDLDQKISETKGIPFGTDAVLADFSDGNTVSAWAKDLVAAIIKSGYVGGSNGMIKPKDSIKRSEFAVVMNRLVTTYINAPGKYSDLPSGNIIVRSENVIIENVSASGDVIIGEGARNGAVLKNTTVPGRFVVRTGNGTSVQSGTVNSIRLIRPGVSVKVTPDVAIDSIWGVKDNRLEGLAME